MADNESTVSMDAEISLSTNKAVSELTKLSRHINTVGDSIANNVKHLDTLLERLVKVGQVGGKSFAEMNKAEVKEASGLLAKAEQIRSLQEQSNKPMPKQSSGKKHKDGYKRKNRKTKVSTSTVDSVEKADNSIQVTTNAAKDIADSMVALSNSMATLANTVSDMENKAKNAESRAKEAEAKLTNAKAKKQQTEQNEELSKAKVETEKSKKKLYDAQAGRITDDYRYNAGWRGGIASGIGGAISRARARSGFTGFAARVGTGVGQLNPGINIMKGATVSGLGLNPMTLAFAAVGAGIAKLTEGLGKLAVESLQAYGEVEKLKTGLSVVFGSDTEANTMFEGIKEYSLESPFGVEQTTEMATLLKQSGIYGTELLDTMKMIGDTAGGNEEKFRRIANNYAQIASIGKASMLDMRQFAYAGIPIYKKVAEELGVSQSVLRQMISDGEVTNEVIEKVFKTMTSEGGEFYKAVERGAETLNARLVNLKDSMNMAKAGIGERLFKLDIVGIGNSSDNQGSLGHLLNFVEELARKADDWATLRNIERDVNAISTRETVSGEIQGAIREAMLRGQDTTALQNLYNKVSGMDTLESNRDIYTQYNKYYQDIAERATTENYNNLQAQLEAVKDMDTGGKSREFKEWRNSTIKSLEEELAFIKDYLPRYTEVVQQYAPGKGIITEKQEFQGKKFAELQEALALTTPYNYQTEAQELSTRMFERGQKTAAASSSLTSFAEQSRQKYLETEQGKDELEAKERAEYEKYARQFNSLRPLVDDTGNIIDDMRINIGQFVELMESGLIEPLEKVSVTWDALAVNTSDTTSQSRDKVDTWQGMASRADDISHLLYILPMELRDSFRSIFDVLDKKDMNTKENVTELNKYMSDLENSQMFNANKNAQNLLQYLLTSNASVLSKIYSYDELKGKGEDNIPPLWKRITGSALGVDAAKITNAKDFYDTYTTQFQGRNISKGVISGMVDSGKSIADITKLLRYTGGKGTIGGVTQNTDTMQIDWVKTAEAMAQFALSTEVTIGELESYGNAIEEQIGAYNELKKTMFTTGEDWDKLDASELAKQFENAFSGIGASMVATNALGMTRQVGLNESGEAIFLDTKELVDAQTEYQLSLENTATAVDEAIDRLRESAVEADRVLLLRQTAKGFQDDTMTSHVDSASAMAYRMGYVSSPDALSATLKSTVASLLAMEEADLTAATKTTSAIARQNQENYNNGIVPENWTDSRIIKSYTGLDNLTSESQDMFDTLARAVDMARETIRERSGIPDTGLDQQLIDAEQFLEALESFSYSKMARSAQGNNPQALADWGVIYAQAEKNNSVESYVASVQAELNAKGSQAWASELSGVDIYNQRKSYVARNVRNRLGMDDSKKMQGASLRLYEMFLKLADEIGVVDVSLEEFARSLQDDYELRKIEAKQGGDLGGYGSALTENALAMYKLEQAQGDKSGQALQLGRYAGGQALGMVSSSIADTDVGAFAQGTMAGGPWVGLANMLLNAIAKVVGGFEVLDYALNPVTNLLQGIAPYLKLIHLPLVVISRGLEMLGEIFAGWLTGFYDSIFGEGTMEGIDRFYESLGDASGQMDEAAQRLEALNQILEQTRKSIMEAEEYFLVQNRTANAQWAAQMQGQFVMDTRATKVNDMILTPHGNFSTAPDDYLLAMKDPTSLMGTGGNTQVSIKFTVNNNASDVVETTTEEQVGTDGQKELIVTISRMVASDYASGRNGWDSAYSGRESRMKGRRVSR